MDPTLAWIDPRTLDAAGRRELWRFVTRYEDIGFTDFAQRLGELTRALVGRHASGEIGALVAASIFTVRSDGRERTMVWGEWGLLDAPFRGRLLLERALLRGVLEARVRHPLRPVYFMAEAASEKGYLALARAFTQLWPRPGHALSDAERGMVAEVLARCADAAWDPARGVFHRGKPMRAEGGQRRVPEALRALREHYLRLNPGHADGDSLLCVARVSWWALAAAPLRALLGRRRR